MGSLRNATRVVTAHTQLEGGGFPVRRPFPTQGLALVDPFLLLDQMGPVDWPPGEAIGAPDHPHRGFETVTYMLEGAMQHADSGGHRGTIGPGDVQWMTAGAGVVHSELPEPGFKARGGVMHGFQIWVNLPRADKMMAPRYQEIPAAQIPEATSADGKVHVRVIAGAALGVSAVIETRTPIALLHFRLQPGASVVQPIEAGQNGCVWLITGSGTVGGASAKEGQLVLLESDGDAVEIVAGHEPLGLLVLAGKPLGEPIARYGPFVMNTPEEIEQAFVDFRAGRLGRIDA